ncbi:MAG: hypothetical protein AAGF67_01745 [Verrucomicrobiota bacterium]
MKPAILSVLSSLLLASSVSADPLSGTWFTYDAGQAVKSRLIISEKTLGKGDYSYWNQGEFGWENVKEFPLLLNENNTVIYEEKGYFNAWKLIPSDSKSYAKLLLQGGTGEDLEDVKGQAAGPEDEMSALFSVPAFTEEEAKKLEELPGLSEISREDLIEVFQRRSKYTELLEEFFSENPDAARMAWRFGQNLFHKELIEMGYNPYEAYEGNPLEKFENDEEIMKLMTELGG